MELSQIILITVAECFPLIATMAAFIYGIMNFFKRGTPMFLQALTLAMGVHALGGIYHIFQLLTARRLFEGLTPAYLGHIGFFLFLVTANVGYMDGIVDDRTPAMRKSRLLALLAPAGAALLYGFVAVLSDVPISTKIAYLMVWLPAVFSTYYNLKHALLPNLDFGFVRAIRPYNLLALCLGFVELLYLSGWCYYSLPFTALSAVAFAVLCIATVITAKKGAEKWTI